MVLVSHGIECIRINNWKTKLYRPINYIDNRTRGSRIALLLVLSNIGLFSRSITRIDTDIQFQSRGTDAGTAWSTLNSRRVEEVTMS